MKFHQIGTSGGKGQSGYNKNVASSFIALK